MFYHIHCFLQLSVCLLAFWEIPHPSLVPMGSELSSGYSVAGLELPLHLLHILLRLIPGAHLSKRYGFLLGWTHYHGGLTFPYEVIVNREFFPGMIRYYLRRRQGFIITQFFKTLPYVFHRSLGTDVLLEDAQYQGFSSNCLLLL